MYMGPVAFIIFVVLLLALATAVYAGLSAAPWVPTRARDIARLLALAQVAPTDVVCDLGCGDGRIVARAASVGAQSVGFEVSLLPYLAARLRTMRERKARVRFANFWHTSLHEATVVYAFLLPSCMQRLKEKLERELKPGSRVITYTFAVPGWTPEKIDRPNGALSFYLYRI